MQTTVVVEDQETRRTLLYFSGRCGKTGLVSVTFFSYYFAHKGAGQLLFGKVKFFLISEKIKLDYHARFTPNWCLSSKFNNKIHHLNRVAFDVMNYSDRFSGSLNLRYL